MSTLEDFAGQCAGFPSALSGAVKAGTRKAALGVTTVARANTQRAATSGRLSGVGKSGAKVGVRYDQAPSGDFLVKATGPYQLIERDTRGHAEPKARRRRTVLDIPEIGFRRSVHHPGTKGRHPFEHAVDAYKAQAPQVVLGEIRSAVKRTFS